MNDNLKRAQAAAHTPEANAKRAASVKATLAKKKREQRKAAKKAAKVTSIPLSAIPDDPPKKQKSKVKAAKGSTNADIVNYLVEVIRLLVAK